MAGAAWCAASPVAPHAFLGSHCSSCSVFGENRQAVTGQCSHPAGIQDDLRHPYPTKPQLNSAPRLPGEHNPRRDTATPLRCPGVRALLSAIHSHVLGIAADDSTLLARKSGLFFSPRPFVDTVRADFGYPQLSPQPHKPLFLARRLGSSSPVPAWTCSVLVQVGWDLVSFVWERFHKLGE